MSAGHHSGEQTEKPRGNTYGSREGDTASAAGTGAGLAVAGLSAATGVTMLASAIANMEPKPRATKPEAAEVQEGEMPSQQHPLPSEPKSGLNGRMKIIPMEPSEPSKSR